ncbi:MAG: glycosyltransferase family 39 protein [Pyrinomonadaceae bacterium]|nr:glycosyltransferase family 39 protein [Pyrinomonadaceae bacterium]
MQLSTLAKRGSLVLFFAVAAFYFYGLGHLPLLGPDEPRYAQIAREMFLRGDLITPTLSGHPWFEKPALLYWMMILSYKLFGVSEWSARLPAAVAGLLTVGAVYFIGRSVERATQKTAEQNGSTLETGRNACPTGLGFWSALAAATTLGIIVFSRAASFDIIVTMTMTWALAFFLMSELEETLKARRRLLVGFYIFIGLSLLAKGLIGIVIPLGIVSAYYVFRRTLPKRDAMLSLFWGIPLALAVAAVWYAPVFWKHGWPFVDQFFIQHQFARYVSDKYRHPAPVYFYLLVLIPLSLPWTAFLFDGIGRIKPWVRRANDSEVDPVASLLILAFAWLLAPLLFFSFSTSKLPGYILPVLPATALIAGHRLAQLNSRTVNRKWAIRATAALCLLLALAAPLYAWRSGQPSLQSALIVAVLLGLAGTFALISVRHRESSVLAIAGATLVVAVVVLHCWAPRTVERETSKHLLQLADQRGYSQTAMYGLQRDDRTPEFYAGGRVVYGPDHEPIMYDGVASVVAESLTRKETLLVFVPLKDVGYFTALKSAQVDVIGDNGRVAILAVTAR